MQPAANAYLHPSQIETSLPNDDKLVVLFRHHPMENKSKSKDAGRPIFDDMEVCEIRAPGSRNTGVFPATSMSHKAAEGMFGTEEVVVTYAERFPRQYQQFKAQQAQTASGTPLSHIKFLTEGRRAELRALNIYTIEQLASIDGQELKNLGPNGRDMKNQAIAYIEDSKVAGLPAAQLAELEALRARNAILEEDFKKLGLELDPVPAPANNSGPFDGMSTEQLVEYISAHTGGVPRGNLSRKMLLKMAEDATPRQSPL